MEQSGRTVGREAERIKLTDCRRRQWWSGKEMMNSKAKPVRKKRAAVRVQRVVSRTDSDILDALQNLPDRIDIIYKRGMPKSDSVPSLRDQINRFLDAEASAANNALSQGGPASNENKQEPQPPLAPANG
jgi:hypothetical protein